MPPKIKRYGWTPDLPDQRDQLYAAPPAALQTLPPSVDLRPNCPPSRVGSLGFWERPSYVGGEIH